MDRSGTGYVHVSVCVCVFKTAFHEQPTSCVPDYYTAIISGLSLALSLSVPLPSISLVPSLKLQYRTKHTVMQRECEAQQSGSSSHHNCIQLLPQCLLHPPLSSLPTLSAPQKTFLLCFSTFCIMCPCLSLYTYYISVTHNLSLFCGNQLGPYAVSSTQKPLA